MRPMSKPLLVVDNYDSFTHNLVQLLSLVGARCEVELNDSEALRGGFDNCERYAGIVISPGPGRPEDAGESATVVRACERQLPILGVCLGHQLIARMFGAQVVRARRPVHGKASPLRHDDTGAFRGLPQNFLVARYHSLVVEPRSLPTELVPCAWTEHDELMGLRHQSLPIVGIQFHPESILSEYGKELISNWLQEL